MALRWRARYCAERDVTLCQAQAVLALLALTIRRRRPRSARS
jgi:hypothetical protein